MDQPEQRVSATTPAKSPVKRKRADIPFRGWAVQIEGQSTDVTPDDVEIAAAVELAKAGHHELRVFSEDTPKLAREIAAQANGNCEQFVKLSREYHAARVAYFVMTDWTAFPIEVMANGDMRDGQHRWLAARFLNHDEVDVVIIEQ